MSKFKSPVNVGEEPEEKHQPLVKANEALSNPVTWEKWLTTTHQSYSFDGGEKRKGTILDNCPGCGGLGFIPVKVKHNIYHYISEYDESEACPICLTGKDKHQRLGVVPYSDKVTCQYMNSCPFKTELQKQEKCRKITCKFDPENKKPKMTQDEFDNLVAKLARFKSMNSELASKIIEHAERVLEDG